ncbi:hypothetical protein BGW42_000696 [Actinomortierella wolfii]|nr:hypothetical protein BGW42_000696 [Actinomortierella wolfii]
MWPVQIQQTQACIVLAISQPRIFPDSLELLLNDHRHSLSLTFAIPNFADTESSSNIAFKCTIRPLLEQDGDTAVQIESFRYTLTDSSLVIVLNKDDPIEWQAVELVVTEQASTLAAPTSETRVLSFVTESNLAGAQSHLREASPWTSSHVRVGKVAAKRVPATNNIHIVAEAVLGGSQHRSA